MSKKNSQKKPNKKTNKIGETKKKQKGLLRIGDQWSAISIIALSQSQPLKALAEFIENSIDAGAKNIVITRGKDGGEYYLKIADDGQGVPRDENGVPNFKYVATHIGDSIKRQMKAKGAKGIQGEFGIGLLSFWTVGECLRMSSSGADGKVYVMKMQKSKASYELDTRRSLLAMPGTELVIQPLFPGTRGVGGEKINAYLAAELRNRILQTAVRIQIIDRVSRSEWIVDPPKFTGVRLELPAVVASPAGPIHLELYYNPDNGTSAIGLYRLGTRVVESLAQIDEFKDGPWVHPSFQGLVDVSFLNLTPGTRLGMQHDNYYMMFIEELKLLEPKLQAFLDGEKKRSEEKASQETTQRLRRAFKTAFTQLPPEEYQWFDIEGRTSASTPTGDKGKNSGATSTSPDSPPLDQPGLTAGGETNDGTSDTPSASDDSKQMAFFDYPGPLFSVKISPANSTLKLGKIKKLAAICKDRKNKTVTDGLRFQWTIAEGPGELKNADQAWAEFHTGQDPSLTQIKLTVIQHENSREAEAWITVTDQMIAEESVDSENSQDKSSSKKSKGLPEYTLQSERGKLWRSRFDESRNLIVINSGHRDYVYCEKSASLKLRYLTRIFTKEILLHNFQGISGADLADRMIELLMRVEESF